MVPIPVFEDAVNAFEVEIAIEKAGCSNHNGISLLSPTYKVVSNIANKFNSICRGN
jgi:hypothetical protein